ncbi:sensor histidine kinase [Umezawaea endophytica]|uniref:histidine kinase n=1 Tax=Umezawaea endophytica TaxID=1654476 RepID=A0A9X2VEQ4_9PSEU|nr:histidine kinase [Umezawaea endophytica]MCS7475281.1 histidine kinase [Umezawaea endophytica]
MRVPRGRAVWPVLVAFLLLAPVAAAPPGTLVLAVAATVVVLAATWRWPVGRVGPAAVVVLVSGLSLLVDVLHGGEPRMALLWMPFEFAGLLVLLGRAVRVVSSGRVVAVTALAVVAAMALPLRFTLHESPPRWDASVLGLLLVSFPLVVAIGVGVYLRGLDSRLVEARVRQRLEIAELLHDFVAHEVTGIVVEVQAARFVEFDEAEAKAAFARIEEAGLRALDSMDRAVAAMRDGSRADTVGVRDVPELVGRFSGSAVRCELADAAVGRLGPVADETAYAVVLEALTNVRRHAAGAPSVAVEVDFAPGRGVVVSVVDGGGARGTTRASGGSGLVGLRERVEAAGGALDAGPHGSGWRVAAVFPAR